MQVLEKAGIMKTLEEVRAKFAKEEERVKKDFSNFLKATITE